MIKVSVIDCVTITSKEASHRVDSVVVLYDKVHHQALGIRVGEAEAFAIDRGLRQFSLTRPMTMNFIANILDSLGVALEEVSIASLKDDIYYATARIRTDHTVHEIDARPSDAIALAVTTGSPIFVSEEVLGRAGVTLPGGQTLHRMETTTVVEQPGQHLARAELVMEEKLIEEGCQQRFQHVLQALTL